MKDKIISAKQFLCSAFLLSLIFTQLCLPAAAQTRGAGNKQNVAAVEKRIALIIGNAAYDDEIGRLTNPANDAADMAATLKGLDFELGGGEAHLNQNFRQMDELVREFGRLIKNGGVGVFYFAGHGIQAERVNYLVPIAAKIEKQQDLRYEAYSAERVLGEIEAAENRLNILILDACRNNPVTRSVRSAEKGLTQPSRIPTGTYVAFAARDWQTSSENEGKRNGLYTQELLKNIKKPNTRLEDVFINTRREVRKLSNNQQTPEEYGSVDDVFYFAGTSVGNSNSNAVSEPPPTVEIDKNAGEREAWNQIKDSTNRSDYALFAETFSNGIYAARARARWETSRWNQIENSSNKTDYEAFLKEFPSGQCAGAAKFAVRRLETATVNPVGNLPGNSSASAVKVGTIRTNPMGMEPTYIPAGEFMMGSTEAEIDEAWSAEKIYAVLKRESFADEFPKHKVAIKERFWMGRYEVTQAEWQAVMGGNTSKFTDCGGNYPVEQVSWDDIQIYLKKMNEKNDGLTYSLPTEAEWEYAARAGTTTVFAFGNSLNSSQANFNGNRPYASTKGNYVQETVKVGSYLANAFGLYDMRGNVQEWTQDIYSESYANLAADGSANLSVGDSNKRVARGGSRVDNGDDCCSADRYRYASASRGNFFGFRIAARVKVVP